ncbi:hypothetical protein ACRE_082930 [Hapsidospora chrysogenum ATCC 11550]|uniref:Uncharacterized protein n=1 Tax=Hapsidospora chrysogenum (strain ATCC 11550 / CBS 779.69 / DSM 880 / IAM 14645 / JCM 23072 / IMI 49137) TaxID=857340 RepID=A0A086SV57_HAPC1|nr:hypothetical protein ACRE_082930 [Hapsidospora chrysogenum ATCC 11550]
MGVINPGPVRNLVRWRAKAEKMTFQLRPGDPWPSVEDEPTPTPSTVPTETPAAPDGQETTAPEDTEAGGGGGRLGDGAIAGIVIGVAVAVALVGVVTFYCGRRGGIKPIFQSTTNEDDSGERAREEPKSSTPGTMGAPIRPPRTPHTENWMPAMNDRGNLSQYGTPIIPASMYNKPPPPQRLRTGSVPASGGKGPCSSWEPGAITICGQTELLGLPCEIPTG